MSIGCNKPQYCHTAPAIYDELMTYIKEFQNDYIYIYICSQNPPDFCFGWPCFLWVKSFQAGDMIRYIRCCIIYLYHIWYMAMVQNEATKKTTRLLIFLIDRSFAHFLGSNKFEGPYKKKPSQKRTYSMSQGSWEDEFHFPMVGFLVCWSGSASDLQTPEDLGHRLKLEVPWFSEKKRSLMKFGNDCRFFFLN